MACPTLPDRNLVETKAKGYLLSPLCSQEAELFVMQWRRMDEEQEKDRKVAEAATHKGGLSTATDKGFAEGQALRCDRF